MTEQNPLIVFTPSGKRGRFAKGTPVLQAARALGVDIDSVCGGRAICGRCQITVGEGEFAKHGISSATGHVSGVTQVEQRYDKLRGLAAGRRLSCQTQILGDLVIDVPPESQVHKQVVRKEADTRVIELDPATHLYYIEVEEPDMHKPSSDLERVYMALKDQWGVENVTCDLSIIADLQKTLRKGEWKITCAVYSRAPGGGNRLAAIWPGFHDSLFGLAIDVGSTTIAAHLTNLSTGEVVSSAGLMNPQIRFGTATAGGGSGEAGQSSAHGHSGSGACWQSGHASPLPRRGPHGTGWCALRAGHRPSPHLPGPRDGVQAQSRRLGLCAAVHRRPCGRGCGGCGAVGSTAHAG
jgi:uncharacterized 2Fe-2S/4Fe-4S cluster protein (DUF4445 family)